MFMRVSRCCLVWLIKPVELRRLQERVRELEAERAQLHQEREAGPSLRGQVDNPGTTERVIYLPRERKCPMFRGTHGIGIDDWVEESRST
uniref:Uncharacterized protein n=1 Tax=Knipowitschia caucasica TaxID=637954 RepID=A0AAV2M4L4_KNICA